VSLHDPDARPIAKGRIDRPIEFDYNRQVVDNEDGIVLDHTLEQGNPADAPQLAPAIDRIRQRTGNVPHAVTADRGYGEARVEAHLQTLGVRTVAIPRKGTTGAARRQHEQRPAFRKLVKWRTGYGWNHTRLGGLAGARIWCGNGIFTHNLLKITALATAQNA
jgi:transposase, IS5 family